MYDPAKFWQVYLKAFGAAPNQIEAQGTEKLLTLLAADPQIERLEWAAYILGTIRNECGNHMMPIKEIEDRTRGRVWQEWQSKYWNTGFYGRGYAQITLEGNYHQFSKLLYGDDRLVKNPDLVMDQEVGYKILSTGVVRGLFRHRPNGTGYKLSDFLNDTTKDYIHCRQVENGMSGDVYRYALRCADYAEKYETCLRASVDAPKAISA